MYRFRKGGAQKRLLASIALAVLALVVLSLGLRGSPDAVARDFEECIEQLQANAPSSDERGILMTQSCSGDNMTKTSTAMTTMQDSPNKTAMGKEMGMANTCFPHRTRLGTSASHSCLYVMWRFS
jgi:hypothetical protein